MDRSLGVYGEPLSEEIIGKAIASFARTLITLDYPLARWLQGDESALSEQQKRGMDKFVSRGCIACHSSPYVSNFTDQKFEIEGGEHHLGRIPVLPIGGREGDYGPSLTSSTKE